MITTSDVVTLPITATERAVVEAVVARQAERGGYAVTSQVQQGKLGEYAFHRWLYGEGGLYRFALHADAHPSGYDGGSDVGGVPIDVKAAKHTADYSVGTSLQRLWLLAGHAPHPHAIFVGASVTPDGDEVRLYGWCRSDELTTDVLDKLKDGTHGRRMGDLAPLPSYRFLFRGAALRRAA